MVASRQLSNFQSSSHTCTQQAADVIDSTITVPSDDHVEVHLYTVTQTHTREEVTREEVTREEVTREEVIREEVTREEVTREEVIREEVTREAVIREQVIREEKR